MNRSAFSNENDRTSLAETAAGWLALRQDGMDERQRESFVEWLSADQAHKQAYDELSQSWEALGAMAPVPRISMLRSEALIANPPRRRAARWVAALAAAVMVGSIGLGTLYSEFSRVEPTRITAQVADNRPGPSSVGELLTMKTERPTMTLADGSKITLNTDARARIAYTSRERRIIMVSGQAFFKVAHDKTRPFIVSVGDREVVAVGTEFDVRIDKTQVVIALLEGKVRVRPRTDTSRTVDAIEKSETVLDAGNELQFALANPSSLVRAVNVDELTRWREGRVRFDATPLGEAVGEMNRYSAVPIEIVDPDLGDIKISGVFHTGQTDSFVAALTHLFPVRAERTEKTIELHRNPAR